MNYEKSLIHITSTLESSESMYSMICLKATGLLLTLNGVRCYLDGYYLLCLSQEDTLTVHDGYYEAQTLHFLPYFYNINLSHNVISLSMYEEMRTLYGYPDFHLFRLRDEHFFGILRLNPGEYEMAQVCFQRAKQHIDNHASDGMWSCRTRSDMISILRIAEGAYLGEQVGKGNEILRYIRDNLGQEITLPTLCKQFHTNRTTLTELMKELTGMSPMQYVLEERLNQSRPDLLFTWIPIQELAEKYGFADTNYYIRAFKKRFGMTPLQYRNHGREERIRNETIYHERERKMMKMEAFESYVRKGLGRAIILLKEQTDKTPFRQPLIDLITKDKIRWRFCGDYEKELIDCFEDRDAIAAEVAKALLSQIEQGDYLLSIPLLVQLGYKDAVIEIVERQYSTSYAKLLEFTKRGDSDEKYPPCAGEYFNAASVLARCKVDAERIKQILTDMANLYHYADRPVVPEYQNPLFMMMDGYGRDALDQLLDEVVVEHPCGSKLEKHSPRAQLITPYPPKPLDNITAEDVLACETFNEEYAQLYVTFRQADESVVREVAERILNEPDRKRQLHWLSFFTTAISPDLDPPAFPLDPTPLVEMVDQSESVIYQDPHSPLADDAARYLNALEFMRHPSVKALGKKMLENQACPKRFRNYALQMFYGANYTPEDREAFTALLLSENSPDRIVFFRIYGDLIRRKTPDIPLDLIPYVFESCDDHSIRSDFVQALIEGDVLSNEIKTECSLDASKRTRRLVMER